MNKSLIISRYKEDLEWLKKHNDFEITVYNKGLKLKEDKYFKVLNLENVGRESHTWLYHIVNNYNSLNDINIFLQGKIDDLNCMAYQNPNDYLEKIHKYGFSASRYGLLGPFHWDWNVNINKDIRYKKQWQNNEISRSKIGFRKFSKQLFPEIPIFVATSYSGCFAVKREIIRQHDINFYKKLLEILSKNKNPIEGHYMERLWCYLFTNNKLLFNSFLDVIKTKIERIKR
ncbi:DUF3431 domain-containing protein [Prochlorococcus sp. AH-716-P13]|nr:DUF3431 domain-containing protein [Prochlorococcus sp. AH-716-P13]